MAKRKETFEESVKRLEQIADLLENGSTGLEESIALFEEGMKLSKNCREILDKASAKIEIVLKDSGETAPFVEEMTE